MANDLGAGEPASPAAPSRVRGALLARPPGKMLPPICPQSTSLASSAGGLTRYSQERRQKQYALLTRRGRFYGPARDDSGSCVRSLPSLPKKTIVYSLDTYESILMLATRISEEVPRWAACSCTSLSPAGFFSRAPLGDLVAQRGFLTC